MSSRTKIPANIRRMVYERDDWSCVHCGLRIPPRHESARNGKNAPTAEFVNKHGKKVWRQLQIDHIHPRHIGGTDMPDNLQSLCDVCNRRKLTSTVDVDWEVRFKQAQRMLAENAPCLESAQHIVEALVGQRIYIKTKTGNDYNEIGGAA